MTNGNVYTLREKPKREGIHELRSSLTLTPLYRKVRVKFIKFIKNKGELKEFLPNSGFKTIEKWVKAAHGSPFLHLVFLLEGTELISEDEEIIGDE